MAIGLDVGTCFIVGARGQGAEITYKKQRDGFFTISAETPLNARFIEQGLTKSGAKFFRRGDEFLVIGEEALEKALERRAILQRPLKDGVINSREPQALEMIKEIISGVLGSPTEENEVCVYSIPAAPIDQEFDIVYHQNILNQILSDLGYKGQSLNESTAVAYSELMDNGLTGIAMSFGAGMTNISILSSGKSELQFSVAVGGDWLDEKVATSLGLTSSLVQMEKEQGLNIQAPSQDSKVLEALAIYYRHFIKKVLGQVVQKLQSFPTLPKFPGPVKLVISGGTSMPEGFVDVLKATLEEVKFPIEVADVVRAESPLETVAKGCYLAASI